MDVCVRDALRFCDGALASLLAQMWFGIVVLGSHDLDASNLDFDEESVLREIGEVEIKSK